MATQLQYSCLGNSMDRGAWWATDWGRERVGHEFVTKQLCFQVLPHEDGPLPLPQKPPFGSPHLLRPLASLPLPYK